MATPYENIYNIFISKITDQDILSFLEVDRLDILNGIMNAACNKFKTCKEDLKSRDDETQSFSSDLSDEVIDIVTEFMITEWLKPMLYRSENYKNVLNTKDFNQFSGANLLKEIRETYNLAANNAKSLMIDYSYRN